MNVALEIILWILIATWVALILSIIFTGTYAAVFGTPAWVEILFQRKKLFFKRIFMVLALAIGITAILLSIVNHHDKQAVKESGQTFAVGRHL